MWAPDAEKEEKIVRIPTVDFNCPKFNAGDTVSFDIEKADGSHVMTLLQVSQVIIEIGWNMIGKNRKRKLSPPSQIICVKSLEQKPKIANIGVRLCKTIRTMSSQS